MWSFKARWEFGSLYKKVTDPEGKVAFEFDDSVSGGKRLRKEGR